LPSQKKEPVASDPKKKEVLDALMKDPSRLSTKLDEQKAADDKSMKIKKAMSSLKINYKPSPHLAQMSDE